MKDTQRKELADLIEQGLQIDLGGYQTCNIGSERDICPEKWGLALIRKVGDPHMALTRYEELHRSLPDTTPLCVRNCRAFAELLSLDWKELVAVQLDHKSCIEAHDKARRVKFFKLPLPPNWVHFVMREPFAEFEASLLR